MAPSTGALLSPLAWRALRSALEKTARVIRERLPRSSKTVEGQLQPAVVRHAPVRQPIHRIAAIRQSQSRWYSTKKALEASIRHFSTRTQAVKHDRASLPSSQTASALRAFSGRAPFASILRPNLTGGTLPRTAGGYGTGAGRVGGARYFSHGPAAPAQVVNNVSAAVRAFWLSGQRLQYDGSDRKTGQMRFKTVSRAQETAGRTLKMASKQAPGSYVDFKIAPVITAIGSLGNLSSEVSQNTLNDEGVMDMLSADFARAFKDLSIVSNDLKKLATIGDLAVTQPSSNTLRVRFPGCDADTVEKLCDELGVQRGFVHEDPDFDKYHGAEMALMFPFAPSRLPSESPRTLPPAKNRLERDEVVWQNMLSPEQPPSPGFSNLSEVGQEYETLGVEQNPWLSSLSDYESLHTSSAPDTADLFEMQSQKPRDDFDEYEGIQGIHRFLEECERARR